MPVDPKMFRVNENAVGDTKRAEIDMFAMTPCLLTKRHRKSEEWVTRCHKVCTVRGNSSYPHHRMVAAIRMYDLWFLLEAQYVHVVLPKMLAENTLTMPSKDTMRRPTCEKRESSVLANGASEKMSKIDDITSNIVCGPPNVFNGGFLDLKERPTTIRNTKCTNEATTPITCAATM